MHFNGFLLIHLHMRDCARVRAQIHTRTHMLHFCAVQGIISAASEIKGDKWHCSSQSTDVYSAPSISTSV